jgi:predicted PurR-regulated permease PerM
LKGAHTLTPFNLKFLGYWLILLILLLAGWLELATPLLTVLFGYLILSMFTFTRSRIVPVILFTVLVLGLFYLFASFLRQAVVALPEIADQSIPGIYRFAQEQGIQLPFDDAHSLRTVTLEFLRHKLGEVGKFATIATKEFAFVVIGIVVAISIFINPTMDLDRSRHRIRQNLYSYACDEITARFQSFYRSFASVMGAQLIISTLNTGFTAFYLLAIHLPYTPLVLVVTFLCGLLPIIGNLISNTVIVAISFTVSPMLAVWSLCFLVVLHKLEYFLNSKIIGEKIRNPVWLTLLGLILGERLMGIPGMILAPVLLHFIKTELASIEIRKVDSSTRPAPPGHLSASV